MKFGEQANLVSSVVNLLAEIDPYDINQIALWSDHLQGILKESSIFEAETPSSLTVTDVIASGIKKYEAPSTSVKAEIVNEAEDADISSCDQWLNIPEENNEAESENISFSLPLSWHEDEELETLPQDMHKESNASQSWNSFWSETVITEPELPSQTLFEIGRYIS